MSNSDKTIRVLYVDDERILRDLISEFLEMVGGYTVQCAVNGQEGVEMAESWKPHFILMDVRMPVMDGIEAIHILRAKPETADIKIFTLTAFSDNETIAECKEAGIDGYFTKPPSFMSIVKTIRSEVIM